MYSRAPRDLSYADPLGPHVGPSSYTLPDTIRAEKSKTSSYAPFTSLTPKISAFEEAVKKHPLPPPGCYEIDRSSVAKAKAVTLFGKSTAPRFNEKPIPTPGPAAYKVIKEPKETKPTLAKLRPADSDTLAGAVSRRPLKLQQRPLTTNSRPMPPSIPSPLKSFGYVEDLESGRLVKAKKSKPLTSPLGGDLKKRAPATGLRSKSHDDLAVKGNKTTKTLPGPKFGVEGSSGHRIEQFLIQPSGGKGGNLYSKHRPRQYGVYQHHNLIMRYNIADVSRSMSELDTNRFYDDDEQNPGPSSYNIRPADKWLTNGTSEKSMKMGDVALPRYVELFERRVTREGVPAPGAYNVQPTAGDPLAELSADGHANTTISKAPRFMDHDSIAPAPNAYAVANYGIGTERNKMPGLAGIKFKRHPNAPYIADKAPFGTTADRFHFYIMPATEAQLGPGAYKDDVVTSIAYQVKKRVATSSVGSRAFGSLKERFDYNEERKHQRRQTAPAPGDYMVRSGFDTLGKDKASQVAAHVPVARASTALGNPSDPKSVMFAMASPELKRNAMSAMMSKRFDDTLLSEAPPPGSYDVDASYKQSRDRGKISITSAFGRPHTSVEEKRETIFDHIANRSPGPAWYDHKDFVQERKEHNVVLALQAEEEFGDVDEEGIGFLSKEERLPDFVRRAQKTKKMPGPASYEMNQFTLDKNIKKTFNVTLSQGK